MVARQWIHRFVLLASFVTARLVAEEPPFYPDKDHLLVLLDPAGNEHPVRTADDWKLRRGHILANLRLVMGEPIGEQRPVALEPVLGEPTDCGSYQRRAVSIAVEVDDRLPGWLLIPKRRTGRMPAMLCLHQTVAVGKDEPAGLSGSPNLHYAAELAERGYVTLAVDYPNFGSYKIDPYARGYASATAKGIWNHQRAIDYLASLPDVDAARIGIIGHSLGGHNSLFLAACDERVRCAVSCCGFCSFRRYYGGNLAGWSHAGYMPRIREVYELRPERMPFDFSEVLAAIAPRGLRVVAPLHDENFDVTGVRESVAAAREVFEFLAADDQLSTDYPDSAHDFPSESRRSAYQWIDQQLSHEAN